MRNQSPMHEPTLVGATVTDNDGDRRGNLFRGYVEARRVLWQIALQIPANSDITKFEGCGEAATHINEIYRCVFEGSGRLSTHALHKSSPCCSACFLVLKIRRLDSSRLISIVWLRSRSKTSPREYHRCSGAGTATP